MKTYNISYIYIRPNGTKTGTSAQVKAETESNAKTNLSLKHSSKGEKIVEWRGVTVKN